VAAQSAASQEGLSPVSERVSSKIVDKEILRTFSITGIYG
jgi:hypothetical protein